MLKDIHIPTLVVQGTVDTLFTLDEGIANYQAVRANGVPVSMLWFCGGHGLCLTRQGDPAAVENAAIAWLNRWLKRDTSVDTGPTVDVIDQNGVRYAATRYPLPTSSSLTAEGSGTLPLVANRRLGTGLRATGLSRSEQSDRLGGRDDPSGRRRRRRSTSLSLRPRRPHSSSACRS